MKLFFSKNTKTTSKELNPLEASYVYSAINFLKDLDSSFFQKYVNTFFPLVIETNKNDSINYVKRNSVIVNRNEIFNNTNVSFVSFYEHVKSVYENQIIRSKKYFSQNVFDVLIFKHNQFFIITNAVNIKSRMFNVKNISNIASDDEIWKTVDKMIPSYFYSYNKTYDMLKNVSQIIDKNLEDITTIKALINELEKNKSILFLYIVNDKNDISVTFKTVKSKNSLNNNTILIQNFNLKQGTTYVKNNFDCFVVGSIYYKTAKNYFKHMLSRSNFYYYTLNQHIDFQNNISYPNLIRRFDNFFLSTNMFENNDNDIDFIIVKELVAGESYDFVFFNLKSNEYNIPFKFHLRYICKMKHAKIRCLCYNDFDKRNPLIFSNKKGPSCIVVNKSFVSVSYGVCYSSHYINKKGQITKKHFKNYEQLPSMKDFVKQLTMIMLKYSPIKGEDVGVDLK